MIVLSIGGALSPFANSTGPETALINISTRGSVGLDDKILIGGFVVDKPSNILIRGVGPSLGTFGLEGVLEDPSLSLFGEESVPAIVADNKDWRLGIAGPGIPQYTLEEAPIEALNRVMESVGAFALETDGDAGLYIRLDPGLYTFQLSSVSKSPGVGLNEVYIVPDSIDPFPPGLRIRRGSEFGYHPSNGGLAPHGAVDWNQGATLNLRFEQPIEWADGDTGHLSSGSLALAWIPTGTNGIQDGRPGFADTRGWVIAPRFTKTGPDRAEIQNLVTVDATGHSFIEEASLTFITLGTGRFTYRWGSVAENGMGIEDIRGTAEGTFSWSRSNPFPENPSEVQFFRVFPTAYSDARPSTTWALRTQEVGRVLLHGDGPDGSDANGARETIVTATEGGYVMHYDGCADDGWLACRAVSTDLIHWEKQGPIMTAGPPGSVDAGCVCSPWTIEEGGIWHMFYLAAAGKTPYPESVPESPYVTLKATAQSIYGPWIKQSEVPTFEQSPGPVFQMESTFQMIFTTAEVNLSLGTVRRTLGLASTDDLDSAFTVSEPLLLPLDEQIENASLYREPVNGLWFVFTNHVGVDQDGFETTDAVWVYWTEDPTRLDPKQKALVVDAGSSSWAKGPIGMPSVVPAGNRLALFYDGSPGPTRSHLGRDIGLALIDLPLRPPDVAIFEKKP